MLKIDFGMIVFNGDYVLKENLESIYPFANRIIIIEGPVQYFQKLGYGASSDNTEKIIKSFPDPDNKIIFIQGQWKEKDDMVRMMEPYFDGDYMWEVDSDELYKKEDMEKVIDYLDKNQNSCYSMAFRLYSFYGGFERYITGMEEDFPVIRIQKIIPGQSKWITHRPPTMMWPPTKKTCKEMGHIDQFQSEKMFGIRIYHYPYVFPSQVKMKIDYYSSWTEIIPNYWNGLFVPWMRAKSNEEKLIIEQPTKGVQEWTPNRRGPAFTTQFLGKHPEVIEKSISQFIEKINQEKIKFGI
jgi:hypothetical protein